MRPRAARGQAIVEYTLLLTISVIVCLGLALYAGDDFHRRLFEARASKLRAMLEQKIPLECVEEGKCGE